MHLSNLLKKHYAMVIVSLAFIFFSLYFASAALHKHQVFFTHYYDLGIMDQIIYNTSRGHFMELTDPFGKENVIRMGLHNDLFLAIFAPLYWVFPSVELLLVLQVIVVASGALALYEIGVHTKQPVIGALAGVLYLLYPPLQWSVLYEFHAVTFATPLLLWGWFFLLIRRWPLMWLFFMLALLTKEQVGFTLGWSMFLGYAYLILRESRFAKRFLRKDHDSCAWGATRYKSQYIAVGAVSIFWSLLSFLYIIPHFGTGSHFAIERFSEYGNSPIEVVQELISHPDLLLQRLFSEPVRRYVSLLLGPLGGVPLLSPILLLGAWPDFFLSI
ncbi:MAG: hypothetical protein UZ21_OP11001000437 [Microgenomates bacterium OLB22]|nr:MAG: hypothetical protein UZ21_OP11001000437 [Microgenomates bacterium OLB22]